MRAKLLLAGLVSVALCAPGRADITYTVTFDDPGMANAVWYDRITSHTQAAGADWSRYLQGDAVLDVVIKFDSSFPRAGGRSTTSSFVGNNGTYNIFEQAAATEIRTGMDPNGATADIEFTFNPSYLANDVWFDPNPEARTAQVAGDRVDGVSVFLHEFGHALGFNGWRHLTNGTLPGDYASTFDELTIFDGSDFYFVGELATALYGGPVPLTFGNIFHLGDFAPRPGENLIPDLMNGVVFYTGNRYTISPLDVAILSDAGVPIAPAAVPEPSSVLLTSLLGVGIAVRSIRRSRRTRRLASQVTAS